MIEEHTAPCLRQVEKGASRTSQRRVMARRKRLFTTRFKKIPKKFLGRILDFDQEAAFLWGKWQGEGDRSGKPNSIMDTQIAAIAAKFDLVLVTRNTKDFSYLPVECFDPFLTANFIF